MKEAGSRWQSNPLAAYILCCTPPRDVQAPYEQREGFPFIYSTKIDITIQVHPLETPTCNPFQHPRSKRGNRNKVVIQPRKFGWPLRLRNRMQEKKLRAKPATDVMADGFHGFPQIIHRPIHKSRQYNRHHAALHCRYVHSSTHTRLTSYFEDFMFPSVFKIQPSETCAFAAHRCPYTYGAAVSQSSTMYCDLHRHTSIDCR